MNCSVLKCTFSFIRFLCSKFKVIDEEKLQENCADVGTHVLHKYALLRDEFPIVGDVRGKGLMIGIEMVADKVIQLVIKTFLFVPLKELNSYARWISNPRHLGHIPKIP